MQYIVVLTKPVTIDGKFMDHIGPYYTQAQALHALAVIKPALDRQGSACSGIQTIRKV